MPPPSAALLFFFIAQVLGLAWFWVWLGGVRVATGLGAWLSLTSFAALAGWLRFGPLPPPVGFVIVPGLLLTAVSAVGPLGDRMLARAGLPLLIGYQSFRILVEIFLWWGHHEGIVPVQLTWEGRNFDVLTGLLALPLAWLTARGQAPRWLVGLWNLAGLALLVNVVTVAVLSMPTPFRQFPQANVFVAEVPFIWLPTFLVPSALFGHLLVFRLWGDRSRSAFRRR